MAAQSGIDRSGPAGLRGFEWHEDEAGRGQLALPADCAGHHGQPCRERFERCDRKALVTAAIEQEIECRQAIGRAGNESR